MTDVAERTCYRHPDRITGLSCSECGRPICTECMTMAPVGIRCPEHSGRAQGAQRMTRGIQRAAYEGVGAKVTKALIAINIAVYVAELAQGANVNGVGSSIYTDGVLIAVARTGTGHLIGVAEGQYWRLITAAFLHYGPFHLLLNMLALWWFGSLLEQRIGSAKFLLLYLVSGLAGSAGALIASPLDPTVGASGAIFGILGAGLVMERQRDYVFGGSALGIIVINLVFTFSIANISIGGHIGGLIGGAACALAMTRFGRVGAAYGRSGTVGVAAMILVGVVSIAVAYWKAKGYAT
ncbi:MAG TPA: rhomboid family intramembrane serine protease [Gaiellaceae bacterium]|jgi:membrane associated rhomboid family serine protease|nr:rhomboid family intramembrane serine protease [Gaiellaceae bacterium]